MLQWLVVMLDSGYSGQWAKEDLFSLLFQSSPPPKGRRHNRRPLYRLWCLSQMGPSLNLHLFRSSAAIPPLFPPLPLLLLLLLLPRPPSGGRPPRTRPRRSADVAASSAAASPPLVPLPPSGCWPRRRRRRHRRRSADTAPRCRKPFCSEMKKGRFVVDLDCLNTVLVEFQVGSV